MGRDITLIMLLFLLLVSISFTLGRRWESYAIKNQLEKNTFAISKWGQNSQIKITGIVEPYNHTFNLIKAEE